MDLHRYLRVLRRYWRSILLCILLCTSLAALVTLLQKPVHTSTASLFVVVQSGDTAGELSQGATYAERQVKSYVDVATTHVVLQPVIDELGLRVTPRQLAQQVRVTSPTATSIIDVSATDGDPLRAASLANSVSKQLVAAVEKLSPPGPDGSQLVSATVIDPGLPAVLPTSPRPALNLALGAALGILIGVGQAVVRSAMDTRVRTSADLAEVTGAPILASIPKRESPSGRGVADAAQWANAEAYRRLRTNVGFVGLGGELGPSMVVSSAVASEGKTETVTNLARALAQAGKTVVLVDADLRRPQVASRMGLGSELGLSDVLTGRVRLEEALLAVDEEEHLFVLPAGTLPPNPSELLGSEAMSGLLAKLELGFEHVLFDAPPLLPVTDGVVLGAQTAGAIVVVRSGAVKRHELAGALGLLTSGDVKLLGVVLNDVPVRSVGYRNYESVYAYTTSTTG